MAGIVRRNGFWCRCHFGEAFGLVLLLGLAQAAQLAEEPELVLLLGWLPFLYRACAIGVPVLQQMAQRDDRSNYWRLN